MSSNLQEKAWQIMKQINWVNFFSILVKEFEANQLVMTKKKRVKLR